MNKKYCAIAVISSVICFNVTMSAQESVEENQVVRAELDSMFENIDKSKVPTSFLLDYAMDLVDFEKYDGTCLSDSNYVTTAVFEDILRSVRSASVATSEPFAPVSCLMDELSSVQDKNTINIGIALFRYNFIKENALTDNLIRYDEQTNKVYDVYKNGSWVNPYGENFIIAFTPHTGLCMSGSIDFNFIEFGNVSSLATLYFDADDGLGYRNISAGSTLSLVCSAGEKELRLKAALSDGKVLESHCRLFVEETNPTLSHEDNTAIPTTVITKSVVYKGTKVEGQMSIFGLNGRTELKKPFIVVEGFDPIELQPIFEKFGGSMDSKFGSIKYSDGYYQFNKYSQETFFEAYDYIYIDWFNSTADIRANAMLLIEFIREINLRKKESGSVEPNFIVGQSMGGLIVRYALCEMERNMESHEVQTFVSHDSPHLGANVPLGAIYMVNDLLSFVSGGQQSDNLTGISAISEMYKALSEILNSQAARQMLFNYVDASGVLDNSVHIAWQNELSEMGFPKGDSGCFVRNLSISDGGVIDYASTYAYDEYLMYFSGYFQTRWLLDLTRVFVALSPISYFVSSFFQDVDNNSSVNL